MRIPEHQIGEIRTANDIVEIVSDYVTLKRSGRNFKGLCPFHKEKTPSFMVNPERQIFHCFGCGMGGDVISFVQNYQKINFLEAVRYLADKAHIEIDTPKGGDNSSQIGNIFEIMKMAADFYRSVLLDGGRGCASREYLDRRGISGEMSEKFYLGYAPDSWDSLLNRVSSMPASKEFLKSSGLFIERKSSSGYYDRFRNRLIFPIFDLSGRVRGFGGRALDDSEPKYINSPETVLYRKGRLLYGLPQARAAVRETGESIIVEGYMDCISLQQFEISNTLASSGTAFTQEQARILARFSRRVYLVFDGDEAGRAAALRSGPIFLQAGLEARIVILPSQDDPDSFIRSHGKDEFERLVAQAPDIIDYQVDRIAGAFHNAAPFEQSRLVRPVLEVIDLVPEPLTRRAYYQMLARRLAVDETTLLDARKPARIRASSSSGEGSREPAITDEIRIEYELLSIMLQKPESIPVVQEYISEDMLRYTHLDSLFKALFRVYEIEGEIDVARILSETDDPAMKRILTMGSLEEKETGITVRWIRDCIKTIHKKVLEAMMKEVKTQLGSPTIPKGEDQAELLLMFEDLARKKASLGSLYREFDLERLHLQEL